MNYQNLLNSKIKEIKPSGIRRFFDIVAEMDDVISLGVGEPDFPTPAHIRDVGIQSLMDGHTKYTSNAGLMELRKAVAAYYERRFHVAYDGSKQAIITVGGSEALDLCFRVLIEPGDEVLVPETPEALKAAITPKTKLLVLPYPNNPTGAIMRREDLEGIAAVLRGTDIIVISDEIYGELTYGGEQHVSIAEIDGMQERTIIVSGFSKAFSMTGWRLGYALGPADIIAAITKMHQYGIMSAPTTAQYAAIEAMENGDRDVAEMRAVYDMRRRLVVDGFNKLGLTCFEPEGAFYCFPCIRTSGLTSDDFAQKLLDSQKVAVVPGNAFGDCGEGFIRVSYCYSTEHLEEALRRIGAFLEELKK
nr:DapC_direct: LL-diaminopimelate [uncultured bacterium]